MLNVNETNMKLMIEMKEIKERRQREEMRDENKGARNERVVGWWGQRGRRGWITAVENLRMKQGEVRRIREVLYGICVCYCFC